MSNKNKNYGGKPAKSKKTPPVNKVKTQENAKKNKVKKQPIMGFSTLNQVAGIPEHKVHHSDIPVHRAKSVHEPDNLICSMCNKKINTVASAMLSPEGSYVHFDCVLDSIKESEKLLPNQSVSYVGSGTFAVCEKGEDGKYTIIKKIPYESSETNLKLKEFVEGLKR